MNFMSDETLEYLTLLLISFKSNTLYYVETNVLDELSSTNLPIDQKKKLAEIHNIIEEEIRSRGK